MESIFEKNLKALEKKDPKLYNFIKSYKNYNPPGTLVFSKNNMANLLFDTPFNEKLAYNWENPLLDAQKHLGVIPEDSRGVAIFTGNGLGYGPLYILEKRPKLSKIVIIEPWIDHFIFALHHIDLTDLFNTIKTSIFIGKPDYFAFEQDIFRLASIYDIHLLQYIPGFIHKKELFEKVNNKIYEIANLISANGGTISKCGDYFFKNRYENLKPLNHILPVENLKDIALNLPAVCVAAGPSLDNDLEILKKMQDKVIIISVDSALSALSKYDIIPDFVTTIDFQDENFEKFLPTIEKRLPYTLIAMNKVSPLIIKRAPYNALSIIIINELPQQWIVNALQSYHSIQAASSAAHLSLLFACYIGANPVILLGQDLGFPEESIDHSKHTVFHSKLTNDREYLYVKGVDGTTIRTDRQFLSIKTLFEKIINENQDTHIINATSKGLHIEGTERIKLDELNKRYENHLINKNVIENIPKKKKYKIDPIFRKTDDILTRIKLIYKKIDKSVKLIDEISEDIKELAKKNLSISGHEHLPRFIFNKLLELDKLNNYLDNIPDISFSVMELTFKNLAEFEAESFKNEEILKKEGYLMWLVAEINRKKSINLLRKEKINLFEKTLYELKDFLIKETDLLTKSRKNKDVDILKELAALYLMNGYANLANKIIISLEENNYPQNFLYYLKTAYFLLMNDYENAQKYKEQITQDDPYLNNILVFIAKNEMENQEKMMLGRFNEGFPTVFNKWAKRFIFIIDLFSDFSISSQILNLWEIHKEIINQAGNNDQHKTENLITQWEPLSEMLPEYNELALKFYYASGQNNKILLFLDKLLEKKPSDENYLILKSKFFLENGYFYEGIAFLQSAVLLNPKTAILWEEIGDLLLYQKNFNEAIIAYENCLKAMPQKYDLFIKLGDAYFMAGFTDAAKYAYETVLNKLPNNLIAKEKLNKLKE